jgi:hypothetical protein
MKQHYSNPNKTSFAYFASGEVTLLQSFSKYALGKSRGMPQGCMIEQIILNSSISSCLLISSQGQNFVTRPQQRIFVITGQVYFKAIKKI